jgi:hypothetical protein
MRITRLVAGLVTAGLVGSFPVLAAAPAHAATTLATTTTIDAFDTNPVPYHKKITISATITAQDGSSPYEGTATLYGKTVKDAGYAPVATAEVSYGDVSFDKVRPKMNSSYYVVYSGGATGTGTYDKTWTGSTSAESALGVARAIHASTPGLRVVGRVTPKYAKKKVKILQVVGKKTKRFATVRTDKKSRFSFRAPNKVGFKFVVVIPADKKYAGTYAPYQVY